jgi:hypothetical protein
LVDCWFLKINQGCKAYLAVIAGSLQGFEVNEMNAVVGNPSDADPTLPVARKAYNSLRRLSEAAQIRVPFSQYGNLLFETKTVVEEALAQLPDGAIKIDLARALEVYTDAAKAWGAVQVNGTIPINTEPGARL